jgi:hypothetical protein
MSNKVNDDVAENYIQEGIEAGLLDSRANLFCVWKMEREGHGTVNEYLAENTLKLPKYAQLNDKLNIISRRKDILEETVRELTEKNRLLEKEVNLSEEKVNNAYKRIAEYANKEYMKKLGAPDTLTGTLIDIATPVDSGWSK